MGWWKTEHTVLSRSVGACAHSPVYPVDISVELSDRSGLLRDITQVLSHRAASVLRYTPRAVSVSTTRPDLTVHCRNLRSGQLAKLLSQIRNLPQRHLRLKRNHADGYSLDDFENPDGFRLRDPDPVALGMPARNVLRSHRAPHLEEAYEDG